MTMSVITKNDVKSQTFAQNTQLPLHKYMRNKRN